MTHSPGLPQHDAPSLTSLQGTGFALEPKSQFQFFREGGLGFLYFLDRLGKYKLFPIHPLATHHFKSP